IRSADDGAERPLLCVARTDRVRVVVQIPDADVPYLHVGHPVRVRIDALGGEEFTGTVSRIACRQDRRTRCMRAEIDLANSRGRLGDGMYGGVTISVPASSESLTVPHSCLVGQSPGSQRATVYVWSDGRVRQTPVAIARSNGEQVELFSGLSPSELVVVNPPEGLLDGAPSLADVSQPPQTETAATRYDPRARLQPAVDVDPSIHPDASALLFP
ncbi:MAG: efflux RND transporter periplasmic adaptor subunit, partial [Planctomycetes bacterium]|nr:efflux RND transporter periplasmic adaptor subunit [Planctomycetota bacterium]